MLYVAMRITYNFMSLIPTPNLEITNVFELVLRIAFSSNLDDFTLF